MAKRGPTRESLQADIQTVPVLNGKRLQMYFNGSRQLLLQGEAYFDEGELIMAYVFLKRFLTLAVKGIPSHKDFNMKLYSRDKNWLMQERQRIFLILETISSQLDAEDSRAAAAAASKLNTTGNRTGDTSPGAEGGWWDDLPEAPTGAPSSVSSKTSAERRLPPGPPPPYTANVQPSAPPADAEGPSEDWGGGSNLGYGGGGVGVGGGKGMVPGDGVDDLAFQNALRTLSLDQGDPASANYPSLGVSVSQQERPSRRLGARTSVLGLKRRVVLPSSLVAEFEEIAKYNTDKPPYGIETCGILAGRLSHNVLEMTTLIIPKQQGTSDSCETTDETGLFNYMLAHKLITIGWIHTHPKQECFMSSVDLHTHCGYQLMLPEALAVVYAPSDNRKRLGVFRLTEPDGMKLIQECKLKGFHVHPDGVTIYENADLKWSPVRMSVVDLR